MEKSFLAQQEYPNESLYPEVDAVKEKNKEIFERRDAIKQDRHTGKGPDRQKDRFPKEQTAKAETISSIAFTKDQIAQGIKEWEGNSDDVSIHPRSGLNDIPEFHWKEELKRSNDSPSWNENIEFHEPDISLSEAERQVREQKKKNKALEKEARDERKIRNFSRTGDPDGDTNRTSMVH